jgi:hypothetical protein
LKKIVNVNVNIDALIYENDLSRNKIEELEQRLGIFRISQSCIKKDVKVVKAHLDKGKSVVVNDFVGPKSKTFSS